MPHFHRRVRVGSVRKGAVQVAFPLRKSGRDPDCISGQRQKIYLFIKKIIEENVAQKFVRCSMLLLFVYCTRSSFSLDLLAGYTVSGCYEITDNNATHSHSIGDRTATAAAAVPLFTVQQTP